ncbi:MAG: serine/threonine protein kinase, partial [Brachybacterium sp.]|nr:serine/threonine protein kinase [Brachybacterium sp.]
PQWAQQTPPQGALSPQSAPLNPHPFTVTQTGTGPTGQNGSTRGSTMIAVALGTVSALVLGAIVAIVLLLVFDNSSATGPFDGAVVSSVDVSCAAAPDGAGPAFS